MTNPIFCVWCPPYLEWSGGSLALHRLVHLLSQFGYDAFAVGCHKNTEWGGGLIQESEIVDFLDKHPNAIMVYPEVVKGNPYNAKNVVRWLLNNPLVTIGEQTEYPENELLFDYCPYYSEYYKDRIIGTLAPFDFRLDTYVDKGRHVKGKVCYTIRKGYNKPHDKHPYDAILIKDYGEQQLGEELIKIFDGCETFISYDHNCFLSVHAALRGCDSIVIPDDNMTAEQWRNTAAFMKYGIAYGMNDLVYARATRQLIKPMLQEAENLSLLQVQIFISECKRMINPMQTYDAPVYGC